MLDFNLFVLFFFSYTIYVVLLFSIFVIHFHFTRNFWLRFFSFFFFFIVLIDGVFRFSFNFWSLYYV